MKKIFLILVFLLVAIQAFAAGPYLACDLPDPTWNVTQCQVEVTVKPAGTVTISTGLGTIRGSDYLLLDLGSFASGQYTFRGRWANASGLWSDWSLPWDATKPAKPGVSRIIY